jgi:hypothetical protein
MLGSPVSASEVALIAGIIVIGRIASSLGSWQSVGGVCPRILTQIPPNNLR